MIDILDKQKLENLFAQDFSSPCFPILANTYLKEGDLKRAQTVCEVGLQHDESNTDGKFILSQVFLSQKQLIKAEKLLKQVVDENPAHFNGLRNLIKLEIELDRSPKTIKNYIDRILKFLPEDSECKDWMVQLNIPITKKTIKTPPAKAQTTETIINDSPSAYANIANEEQSYTIDKSMLTFTMVQILKSQKHYTKALAVLKELETIGKDSNKISTLKNDILKLIDETSK